mmetsp:Transcript_31005/g.50160  ORF Transcript_31005/g.50160 Transcript_31005/m.50160 type:complete len:237 (-) Transcript_31005:244-954(-)|eukprot:CAMPEP_0184657182 /NCGR_PEP_ID=MMETSP0308-20130426/17362_1 /TAXON_ID=38269 /ORGANISM="Gloeochaete witrockiana, Strain SAG 46.84" /LENGTH=236 /DNA_ID=CAMNT_0027094667 /DNA_START=49 /DNA_END=759 /DNA_ORIENTATION=+
MALHAFTLTPVPSHAFTSTFRDVGTFANFSPRVLRQSAISRRQIPSRHTFTTVAVFRTFEFALSRREAALVTLAAMFGGGKSSAPELGTLAPDFTLEGRDGSFTLSKNRGKWIVLYFYPADFTSGCTLEARRFQEDLPQFRSKNVEIIGVSADDVSSHDSFCNSNGLRFPLLSDNNPVGAVSKAYDSWFDFKLAGGSARHTFIIDPDGVVRERYLSVRPGTHSKQVLARIEELQSA